jgi:acetolactate synthase-1/2/3 large subunit
MGDSLAASIGACFAANKKPILCIIGDGGLQVNIQELGTIVHYQLPIKIFLFNNHGYGIVQQTQDDWLESRYYATRPETGLPDPDYAKIAQAYGIKAVTARHNNDLRKIVREVLDYDGPVLCNLEFDPNQRIYPMLKYGMPIEDPNPLLPREQFLKEMIVKPLAVSLTLEE